MHYVFERLTPEEADRICEEWSDKAGERFEELLFAEAAEVLSEWDGDRGHVIVDTSLPVDELEASNTDGT